MASRHDIINIEFQANAGKANAALQSLQTESKKAKDEVTRLRAELENAKAAKLPTEQIEKLEAELKSAESVSRQWSQALNNNLKGVRALDEAIKTFNSDTNGGKGSVEGMSAALSKAARNAAELQKSRSERGGQTWREMDALIQALDKNIIKAKTDTEQLVATIRNKGKVSKQQLSQEAQGIKELLSLIPMGTKEYKQYSNYLTVIEGKIKQVAEAERRAAGAAALKTSQQGGFAKSNIQELEQAIAKLKEYQSLIAAPNTLGKKKFEETGAEITKLQGRLDTLKQKAAESEGQIMSLANALKLSSTAGGKGFAGTATQLQQAEVALQKAAAAAKKGSPEWIKYQEALSKVRVEMGNAGMTSERMREIIAKPVNAKNLNELQAAVKRAKAELDIMAGTVGKNSAAYTQLAEQTKKAEIQMKTMQAQSHGTASAFEKAWSRLKTYVGLYVGAAVAMQKMVATMGDLMELSDKMGEVRKTTGFTADEVGRLSTALAKMDTRTTLTGLMELSAVAGQLGLKTEQDVRGFTEAANMLMVALPEMGKEGATAMLKVALATGEIDKIRQQMQQGLVEGSDAVSVAMTKIGSTIDSLRANSAAAAPAITDFVKRVGAVGAQSGITIDQVAALGSTVDALGMRVEMSATALSRMIPAIKNNAFEIAKAIGVTPDAIRNLFDAGRGMEAILMILQHIKDSGADVDGIEQMLGMGGMADIMKDLNQQGARAGIVFAGLSQNVDELRRQLGVAAKAYEENIAIQNEYNKMNETTAAKWERLKNQVEEMFVTDTAQRWLGRIVDGMRWIADFISENLSPALNKLSVIVKVLVASVSVMRVGVGQALLVNLPKALSAAAVATSGFLKNVGVALGAMSAKMGIITAQTRLARMEWAKMDMAMKQNLFGLLAAAIGYAVYKLVEWRKALNESRKEQGRWAQELLDAEQAIEKNFKAVDASRNSIDKANKELVNAQVALKKAKKAMDGSKESADQLAKAEENEAKAESKVKEAKGQHRAAIENLNSIYGKYLGFTLSEISSKQELANAQELVNSKLREEIALKRRDAALGRIEEEVGGDRDKAYGKMAEVLGGSIRKQVTVTRNGKEVKEWVTDNRASQALLREVTKIAQTGNGSAEEAFTNAGINLYETTANGKRRLSSYGANLLRLVGDYQKEYQSAQAKVKEVSLQFDVEMDIDRQQAQERLGKQYELADAQYAELEKKHAKAQGDAKKQAAADLLSEMDTIEGMIANAKNHYKIGDENYKEEEEAYKKFIERAQNRIQSMKKQRNGLLKEAGTFYKPVEGAPKSADSKGGGYAPWGSSPSAGSTDYATWDVDELVKRRNQMDRFKNVLKPDTDVRAVLAEDKALMKALDNGLKSDWKSVLNWYNQERKKIQDELKSERFSTNEGHWRDEKEGKGRKNRFRESDYALAELDRYYSKRKEALEKARIEEGMSEELFNRQAELLEQEHLERRSRLRETFTAGATEKEREMVKEFRKWWKQLQDTGALDDVPWKTVESEWANAIASEIGRNNLKAQQDLTQLQQITVKHLNEIAKIIDKERPYDGITANLRKNLTEADVLLADMQKEGPATDTAELVREEQRRMKFLLTQAEQAYSLNFEQLKERMIKDGFGEWADAVGKDEQLKQALMAALRNTYDAIQEAIKKEASIVKKQLEIQWNDILPGRDRSIKDQFEGMLSQLGLQEDQVKRANSLINAGPASERVADKLAIQQMNVRLQMQKTYFDMMQKIGLERIQQLRDSAKANQLEADALKLKAKQLRDEGKEEEAVTTELKAQRAERNALQDSSDAEHAQKSLNLAKTKEATELEKQRVAIANQLEESQNRLYKEVKSYVDLLKSGLQRVFEASNTGNAEFYNERAKLELEGGGGYSEEYRSELEKLNVKTAGGGAGQYVIIENAGTEDATAHYEYLTEMEYLERKREIEQDNATKDAWKAFMDDLAAKMDETITDQLNAMFQNQTTDANTEALRLNTQALNDMTTALGGSTSNGGGATGGTAAEGGTSEGGSSENANAVSPAQVVIGDGQAANAKENIQDLWKTNTDAGTESMLALSGVQSELPSPIQTPWQMPAGGVEEAIENMEAGFSSYTEMYEDSATELNDYVSELPTPVYTPWAASAEQIETGTENMQAGFNAQTAASKAATDSMIDDQQRLKTSSDATNTQMQKSNASMWAKMTQAMNLYGVAYQAMSNDNLSTEQKFEMIALQAAGNAAMAGLQVATSKMTAKTSANMAVTASESTAENGPILGPILFAVCSALIGGLMGLAMSKLTKAKSDISAVTGASSASTGKLTTGMLTYAEGNVNEFTSPGSLQAGRSYNVDAADGRTYRARYMGSNPKTHITNGPEFHLAGERGREMIIDAGTTHEIVYNEPAVMKAIQTLSGGGRIRHLASQMRRGRGVAAFADGNIEDFEGVLDGTSIENTSMDLAALQSSLDRQNELLEDLRANGIKAHFDVYGKDGLIDSYDRGKKFVSERGWDY